MTISIYWSEEDTQRNPEGGDDVTTVIGRLDIDAIIREDRAVSSTLTARAIETGVPASDHSIPAQEKIPLECVVSNTPNSLRTNDARREDIELPNGEGATVIRLDNPTIIQDVYRTLHDLVREAREVDVEGLLEDVESFVITDFAPSIEAGKSGAMFFSMVLTEKRTATVQEVETPSPRVERGRSRRDRGRQRGSSTSGNASNDPSQRSSALARLRDTDVARQIQQGNYSGAINLLQNLVTGDDS